MTIYSGEIDVEGVLNELSSVYGAGGGIWATQDQWRKLLTYDHAGTVSMITFARYNKAFQSHDQAQEYFSNTVPLLISLNVFFSYMGKFESVWQGDGTDEEWDEVILLNFPTRWAIPKLFLNPIYIAGHKLREQSLAKAKTFIVHPSGFASAIDEMPVERRALFNIVS